jgi:AcrR family transcriptional regulator
MLLSIRNRMDKHKLDKTDWLRAARRALLRGGSAAVRVEPLAAKLKVTKGSFYWHFRDRAELLETIMREWELETTEQLAIAAAHDDVQAGLQALLIEIGRRVVASERGEAPSDAAIFAWSATAPEIARRVSRVEAQRLAFLERVTGSPQRAELAYLCYLGFVERRRRVPGMSERFTAVMESMLGLVMAPGADRKIA